MKNQFTKGPVKPGDIFPEIYHAENGLLVADLDILDLSADERQANMRLCVSAFNAATKLADMGLDAQATIEALPEIMDFLKAHEKEELFYDGAGGGRAGMEPAPGAPEAKKLLIRCKGAE